MLQTFTSKHYPTSRNAFVTSQEYAMQYYGIFSLALMLTVLLAVVNGKEIMWLLIVGASLAAVGANIASRVALHRTLAAIVFSGEHFMLLTVRDILDGKQPEVFPIAYASPQHGGNTLSIHYHDQLISLRRADWGDFDRIWVRLTLPPQTFTQSATDPNINPQITLG